MSQSYYEIELVVFEVAGFDTIQYSSVTQKYHPINMHGLHTLISPVYEVAVNKNMHALYSREYNLFCNFGSK